MSSGRSNVLSLHTGIAQALPPDIAGYRIPSRQSRNTNSHVCIHGMWHLMLAQAWQLSRIDSQGCTSSIIIGQWQFIGMHADDTLALPE